MTINIFQVPPGTDFNFCGCGNGTGDSGDGGQLPPGGTVGGATYNGEARVIDICANVETIFQDPIAEYINTVQTLQYIPVLAQIDELAETVGALSVEDFTQLEQELYSPEVTLAFKKWIVKHFDDPFLGFVNRPNLRNTILLKTPLTVNGALFQPILLAWADTADIQALNFRIESSAGTASLVGECADLQRQVGREPYQPPAPVGETAAEEFTTTQGYLVRYYDINAAIKDEEPRYLDIVPTGYELVAYAGSMRKARSSATARATMTTLQGDGTETLTHNTWFTNEDDLAEWNEVYEQIPLMDDVMNEVYTQFGDGREQTKITEVFTYQNPTQYGWRITNGDTTVQVNDYAFIFREIV